VGGAGERASPPGPAAGNRLPGWRGACCCGS